MYVGDDYGIFMGLELLGGIKVWDKLTYLKIDFAPFSHLMTIG